MILVNQTHTEAFNLAFVRNIFVVGKDVKVATDFSRGGLLGSYSDADAAVRAFERMMSEAYAGHEVVTAPSAEAVRAGATKARRHFEDGSVQKGHGGS